MKKTIKSNVENCLINQVENYLIELESGKNNYRAERFSLNKILHMAEAFAMVEPLTEFGDFAEILSKLRPDDAYMLGLLIFLDGKDTSNLTEREKGHLARIQDCLLRCRIINGNDQEFKDRWAAVQRANDLTLH